MCAPYAAAAVFAACQLKIANVRSEITILRSFAVPLQWIKI